MKKVLAIGTAAVLAVSTSLTTAQPANAFWPWWGWAIAAGAVVATGAVLADSYGRHGLYNDRSLFYNDRSFLGDDHLAACEARYRSYDPSSDTFLGRDGNRHYCRL